MKYFERELDCSFLFQKEVHEFEVFKMNPPIFEEVN